MKTKVLCAKALSDALLKIYLNDNKKIKLYFPTHSELGIAVSYLRELRNKHIFKLIADDGTEFKFQNGSSLVLLMK